MEVNSIQMDPRIARIHYRDYVEKVREHRKKREADAKTKLLEAGRELRRVRTMKSDLEKEDEQLLASFRALSRGERILNVNSVILHAGLQETTKLPAIAIAGADWKWCYLRESNGQICFSKEEWPNWSWKAKRFMSPLVSIDRARFPAELTNANWREGQKLPSLARSAALVPAIPAHLRPDTLEGYFILWEPEWQHKAPVDPFLLKHVSGPIYTIVAQWDLTPLEQSILEGRIK